jgi:hypothetical protein
MAAGQACETKRELMMHGELDASGIAPGPGATVDRN